MIDIFRCFFRLYYPTIWRFLTMMIQFKLRNQMVKFQPCSLMTIDFFHHHYPSGWFWPWPHKVIFPAINLHLVRGFPSQPFIWFSQINAMYIENVFVQWTFRGDNLNRCRRRILAGWTDWSLPKPSILALGPKSSGQFHMWYRIIPQKIDYS